jgi:hypothetical protein
MADEPVITHGSVSDGVTVCGRPIGGLYAFENVVTDSGAINCGKCLQRITMIAGQVDGRREGGARR